MSTSNSKPTKDQIEKLPVWAKTYIEDLRRERDSAISRLFTYEDEQTPSPFYVVGHDCIGENKSGASVSGPVFTTRYIQSSSVCIEHAGIKVEVCLEDTDERRGEGGIRIKYACADDVLAAPVALVPECFGAVKLQMPSLMRRSSSKESK